MPRKLQGWRRGLGVAHLVDRLVRLFQRVDFLEDLGVRAVEAPVLIAAPLVARAREVLEQVDSNAVVVVVEARTAPQDLLEVAVVPRARSSSGSESGGVRLCDLLEPAQDRAARTAQDAQQSTSLAGPRAHA